MNENRLYEENKTLRDEVCRQRVALGEYQQSMNHVTEKYTQKGIDNCQLLAENAILKSVINDVPRAKKKLKQIDLKASINNICEGFAEYRNLLKGN